MIKDFKTSGYFSASILFVGVLFIFLAVFFINRSLVASAILVPIGLVILTTHYRMRIDLKNKTYFDYLWICGFKNGEKGTFEGIEYVFLKESKVTQGMNSRVSSSTLTKYVIDGYIKFRPGKKIHLFTRDSRHDVIVRLREIAGMLNTRVIDYTAEVPEDVTSVGK